MKSVLLGVAVLSALVLSACGEAPSESNTVATATPPAPVVPVARGPDSLQELMLKQVVPASNTIWALAEPATPETWRMAMDSAEALIQAGAMIINTDRPVVIEGQVMQGSEEPGSPTPEQVLGRIKAAPADWRQHAEAMQASARKIQTAAASQNLEQVMDAGNELYDTCDSCHQKFWHNDQAQ